MAKSSGISKYAMWVLMGLLILALGGFGAANLSGNVRTIGSVGDKSIPVDDYFRQLNNEINALAQQRREQVSFNEIRNLGLDRAVLQRIVRNRALDNEAAELGLSIGDEALREEIVSISAFQGVDGNFDRESYRFALQRGGLSEAEFETSLREDSARALLQSAILGGVQMPSTYARTLVDFAGEQRSFTYAPLIADDLTADITTPTGDELRAYYDDNPDQFRLPASKAITYAWLSPDMLLDEVEVDETAVRDLYQERIDTFVQPERRLVERLVLGDTEAAEAAIAAINDGSQTFNDLVTQRGLDLADVDLGDVSENRLGDAGAGVFAAESGDVVGPLPTTLGPALFRVNGILPASETTFEQAETFLRDELALGAAVRAVEARAQDLDDQLAGGITLEELAETTEMELGTIEWTPQTTSDIAAYTDFRAAAAELTADAFPQINQLDDGGIYAMRLDEERPERANPFEDATADVRDAFIAARTLEALQEQASEIVSQLEADGDFGAAGLEPQTLTNQVRTGLIDGTPRDFLQDIFAMELGEITTIAGDEQVFIVRLDAVTAPADSAETDLQRQQVGAQIDQALAQDLFEIYSDAILRTTPAQIDQRAVEAVHVNFP